MYGNRRTQLRGRYDLWSFVWVTTHTTTQARIRINAERFGLQLLSHSCELTSYRIGLRPTYDDGLFCQRYAWCIAIFSVSLTKEGYFMSILFCNIQSKLFEHGLSATFLQLQNCRYLWWMCRWRWWSSATRKTSVCRGKPNSRQCYLLTNSQSAMTSTTSVTTSAASPIEVGYITSCVVRHLC